MSKMAADILGQRVSLCYSTIFYKRTNNPGHECTQGQKPGMHGTPKADDGQKPVRHAGTSRLAEVGQSCSIYIDSAETLQERSLN